MDVELFKLEDAFKKLDSVCAEAAVSVDYFFATLNRVFSDTRREAVRKHYSNNWLKMHGYPMRRKTRRKQTLL